MSKIEYSPKQLSYLENIWGYPTIQLMQQPKDGLTCNQ